MSNIRRVDGVYTKSQCGSSSVSITRPNDTTAYTAGDVFGTSPATNITFANILPEGEQHYYIVGIKLIYNTASVISGMNTFTLHLFSSVPTAIADNTAWALLSADKDKYLGSIEIDLPTDLGAVLITHKDNINIKRKLATSSTTIYGQLETDGAFTPGAQDVIDITIETVGA